MAMDRRGETIRFSLPEQEAFSVGAEVSVKSALETWRAFNQVALRLNERVAAMADAVGEDAAKRDKIAVRAGAMSLFAAEIARWCAPEISRLEAEVRS